MILTFIALDDINIINLSLNKNKTFNDNLKCFTKGIEALRLYLLN